MAKKPATKRSQAGAISSEPFPVTKPSIEQVAPAEAVPTADGPTTGYQDGDGVVHCKVFNDGVLPEGWQDTPAGLDNNYREGMVTVK